MIKNNNNNKKVVLKIKSTFYKRPLIKNPNIFKLKIVIELFIIIISILPEINLEMIKKFPSTIN